MTELDVGVRAGEAVGAGVADGVNGGVAVGTPVQATAIITVKAADATIDRCLKYIGKSCQKTRQQCWLSAGHSKIFGGIVKRMGLIPLTKIIRLEMVNRLEMTKGEELPPPVENPRAG